MTLWKSGQAAGFTRSTSARSLCRPPPRIGPGRTMPPWPRWQRRRRQRISYPLLPHFQSLHFLKINLRTEGTQTSRTQANTGTVISTVTREVHASSAAECKWATAPQGGMELTVTSGPSVPVTGGA